MSRDQLGEIHWDELDLRKYYFYAPAFFLGVRTTLYPMTLVKTRLQLQNNHQKGAKVIYSGVFDAFRKITRVEGVKGLYKGFGANVINVLSGNVYISMYEFSKNQFRKRTQNERYANFVGGACASVVSQIIVVPLDIVSQRMMITGQGQKTTREKARGLLSISKSIYLKSGIPGFYRGYLTSIATYAPSSGLWWGLYGVFSPRIYNIIPDNVDSSWRQVIAQSTGGGLSGLCTAVLTNPMDIVRTRTQIYTEHGPIDTFKLLIKKEGVIGLWNGATARMMAMGPSGVLVISTYELVKRLSLKTD